MNGIKFVKRINRIFQLLLIVVVLMWTGCQNTGSTPPKAEAEAKQSEGNTASVALHAEEKPNAETIPSSEALPQETQRSLSSSTSAEFQTAKPSSPVSASDSHAEKNGEKVSAAAPSAASLSSSSEERPQAVQTQSQPDQPRSASSEQQSPEKDHHNVTISIAGDTKKGVILSAVEAEFKEGDTVLAVLRQVTRDKKIQMEYRGVGPTAYVQGIANLYEFDRGPKSGWMYRVNGKFGNKSAGSVKLNNDDVIEWVYTNDLGKDVGDKTR